MPTESTAAEGATPEGSTRREVLRRAGLVAGAGTVAWAAPTITTLGSAAFAAGTEAAPYASVLTQHCGLATSGRKNDGPYRGLYSEFTATFPGAAAGVPVERVVLLDGAHTTTSRFRQTVSTDADGRASGYSDIAASIPVRVAKQATVTFTLKDASKRSITVTINLTTSCGT